MKNTEFKQLYQTDLTQSIQKIATSGSFLKNELFKAAIKFDDINNKKVDYFMNEVNSFLKKWDDYASGLMEKIKSAKGSKNVNAIAYADIKETIYAKYDYASVLQFTDGLMRGIEDGKFESSDDINDFFEHTVTKAFGDQPTSVGGLVDAATNTSMSSRITSDDYESRMFNSIRTYNIFNPKNRVELYKAIDKTVDFLINDDTIKEKLHGTPKEAMLCINLISSVIEYMKYSLAIFAIRVYDISSYAFPYINSSNYTTDYAESVEDIIRDTSDDIRIMTDADDVLCRNYENKDEFFNIFDSFLTSIGAEFEGPRPSSDVYISNMENNAFCSKLFDNAIHKFLTGDKYRLSSLTNDSLIDELNQIMKELTYNNTQALDGSSSPKQEVLHVIRGVRCDNTLEDYKQLARDLYTIGVHICGKLANLIKDITERKNDMIMNHNMRIDTINNQNSITESIRIMTDLYRDISLAVLQRARDIEMQINKLKAVEKDKLMNKFNLNIISDTPEMSTMNTMTTAVPITMRGPLDTIKDLYTLPVYESMMMYDEYLHTLPEFSDQYFSEGVDLMMLIDKIMSVIDAAFNQIQQFFRDKKVIVAMNWVKNHEERLNQMEFNFTIKAEPFKKVIGLTQELKSGYDNMIAKLKNFSENDVADMDSLKKFINGLYPKEFAEWYSAENKEKNLNTAQMFKNYILYENDKALGDKAPSYKEFTNNDAIHGEDALPNWISTVKDGEAAFKEYSTRNAEIRDAVKNIKVRLADLTSKAKREESQNKKPEEEKNPNTADDKQTNTANNTNNTASNTANKTELLTGADADKVGAPEQHFSTTDKTVEFFVFPDLYADAFMEADEKQPANDKIVVAQTAVQEITNLINRIWTPLGRYIVYAIRTEYKYIKELYSKGSVQSGSEE